jgi:hypothetical protein
MEDSFFPNNLAISAYNYFSISIIFTIFPFSLMERTPYLLLGLEALPTSLLLRFGAIIRVSKGFLNTIDMATNSNSVNARSRMVASLQGSVGTGTKEDESSNGHIWVAGFHHVMAHSQLASVLKLMNRLFL